MKWMSMKKMRMKKKNLMMKFNANTSMKKMILLQGDYLIKSIVKVKIAIAFLKNQEIHGVFCVPG